jgi:hypothetical protein
MKRVHKYQSFRRFWTFKFDEGEKGPASVMSCPNLSANINVNDVELVAVSRKGRSDKP